MKKFGWVMIVILMTGSAARAQFRQATNQPNQSSNGEQGPLNKFYFGGGGGFGVGTSAAGYSYNYYSLFPIIGYRLTDVASVGTGFNYQRFNYPGTGISSYTQYGFSPFFRYNVNPIFFQAEYDLINAPIIDNSTGTPELSRSMFSRLLFGIGYSIPTGRRGAVNALVMYDVLYRQPSVFNSPLVVRVFFTF